MKSLNISAGSTKIAGLYSAAKYAVKDKGYTPDVIGGVSAGAILTIPVAMGLWTEMDEIITRFTLSQIFDNSPVNKKGKISLKAIFRLALGFVVKKWHSLGTQKNLNKTLSKIVTKELFEEYQSNDKYAVCYVGGVNFNTGSRAFWNLKECNYEEYLNFVNASASMPFAVEAKKYKGDYFFDGGVRNAIATPWMFENIKGIKENISIYSRDKDVSDTLDTNWSPKNIFKVFERYTSITNIEISKKDEKMSELLAKHMKVKETPIFVPRMKGISLYDTRPEVLSKLYENGRKAAIDVLG